MKVCEGLNNIGWFDNLVEWKVGNGEFFRFWGEMLELVNLAFSFLRLFSNSDNQQGNISNLGHWDGEVWCGI